MVVVTFGAVWSPSAADYVKTINALEHQHTDPRAVKAITEYHYVDDYVNSFTTETEAIVVSTRVREIHANAGFDLCHFASSLGQHGESQDVGWCDAKEKILGMYWQPTKKDFKFNVKFHKVPTKVLSGERIPTKREFLSLIMLTFDPLGILCCFMITAKLLLREIHSSLTKIMFEYVS